jgi:hypothetical protein
MIHDVIYSTIIILHWLICIYCSRFDAAAHSQLLFGQAVLKRQRITAQSHLDQSVVA